MPQDVMPQDVLILHPRDNVAVARRPLSCGQQIVVGSQRIRLSMDVPLGHKVAIEAIEARRQILKYGHPIGTAGCHIAAGQWVHTHNVSAEPIAQRHALASDVPPAPAPLEGRTFLGYRRPDGRSGTRNYVLVVSSVNCSASAVRAIARRFEPSVLRRYPSVDGVVAITHETGCGMPLGGEQHKLLCRVLAGMVRHPNVGGFLLVGLGCEQGSLDYLVQTENLVQIGADRSHPGTIPMLTLQGCGGTARTVEAGVAMLAKLLPAANDVRREPLPASGLVLGTECGGSDAYSGITANPAVGEASDLLVAAGGTAILAETPEIYGAEGLLTRRARCQDVAQKLISRIEWWQSYAAAHGAKLDNNPTVGNKEGGLTTIYEKSLGAVAKSGSTALMDVLLYAEPVTTKGLVVMDTPGYDPVSVTGMVAGGANVVVFTTGRGSCFGCKPTPSIKVASNSRMFQRMEDDMDINAGTILEGKTIAAVGREIFEEILAVASGKQTKSEQHGIGEEEFVPWNVGPTL